MQLVALVELQVSVEDPPLGMLEGLAPMVTVGAAGVVDTWRTSMAFTHASVFAAVKVRLSVASLVTVKTLSTTVLPGTVTPVRTRWPSAVTLNLRTYVHGTHDSRSFSVTSTTPGVTGIA